MSGSLNLSMEAQRNIGVNGLAPALLSVPGGRGALPFANDVLLYRYLPDAVLRQRSTSLTLHGSGMVQGSIRRWGWNVTTSYDRVQGVARSERGVPIDDLQAAIDAGGDPLARVSPEAAALRLADRSRTVTGTLLTKAVANGPLVRLPAGDAQITLSGDYARSSSSGSLPGLRDTTLDLTRTTGGASVNADLPIASANQDVLAFLGQLSVNGMIGVSDVSDYGRLLSSNYGLTWSPVRPVQLIASVNAAQTPPAIALLTNPTVTTPNTPFFDFTTGTSVLVTTIAGGNPALDPEQPSGSSRWVSPCRRSRPAICGSRSITSRRASTIRLRRWAAPPRPSRPHLPGRSSVMRQDSSSAPTCGRSTSPANAKRRCRRRSACRRRSGVRLHR
ncbi:hypothetical protein [Sphingomonas aerolata]|uniref:hypothetical protein n=1 Tax=Sphingomonas aerolata TaxID=185951 RepID=UPI002FE37D62